MYINKYNSESYIKKILSKILKSYLCAWIGTNETRFGFFLSEMVNSFGQKKMDLIKYRVQSMLDENKNLEYVYFTDDNIIKGNRKGFILFQMIGELVCYYIKIW